MRVLHVLEAVRGGTSRHVLDVIRTVPAEHHLAVPPAGRQARASGAATDSPALEGMVAAGACLHWVEMCRTPAHPINALAPFRLRHLVVRLAPEVVHAHSSVGGALGRLAAGVGGGPAVYTPHGLAVGRFAVGVERLLAPFTARLIAVSESEAEAARRLLPDDRVVTIPNGIELQAPDGGGDPPLDLRRHFGLDGATPLVGTVVRLVEQKAPTEFVAVCARVSAARPDAHFVLIGMGPLQEAVDDAVAAAGLDGQFHQLPHVPRAAAVLDQLEVFVLASRFEGAPYTPLEAMRAGVPVVLSDVVGNRDVVEHGRSGFLRPFGDASALAGDVLALLADPALAARVARAARSRLQGRFDVRTMGARLASLYLEVAAERTSTRRLPRPAAASSANPPPASASQ